ncbi:MAG: sporulation protein YqfC [Clostridia bacterium]|nr:sporulation protein YqfC [Clostridia bacterium]
MPQRDDRRSGPPSRRLLASLAEGLELPRDAVLDLPRITVIGDLEVTVENHRGLVRYAPEEVLVGVGKGRLRITGRDLSIALIHDEALRVVGRIAAIQFLPVGSGGGSRP